MSTPPRGSGEPVRRWDWALPVLDRTYEYLRTSDRLVELTVQGVRALTNLPHVVEAADAYLKARRESSLPAGKPDTGVTVDSVRRTDDGDESEERRLARIRELGQFAQEEIDRGFPLLYSHALVGAWGTLEAMVTDLVAAALDAHPELLASEVFAHTKIRLSEYEQRDHGERLSLLVSDVNMRLRGSSVTRLEELLGTVALSGSIDPQARRRLHELGHIRNVIVHRSGVADPRLTEECPSLGVAPGQRITVDENAYRLYTGAAAVYLVDVLGRVRVYEGDPVKPPRKARTNRPHANRTTPRPVP